MIGLRQRNNKTSLHSIFSKSSESALTRASSDGSDTLFWIDSNNGTMPPRRNDGPRANANRDDQMAEAMNNMAASVAAQTTVKTLWNLEKRGREICAAESRELEDFHRYNPPKFKGDENLEKADQWIQKVEKIFWKSILLCHFLVYVRLKDKVFYSKMFCLCLYEIKYWVIFVLYIKVLSFRK
uniref:Uncharacterized protein LOC101498913 n=1 Tax=Cicer arietinum TaxID=3827 RepID=A0A1S3EGA4_CICAR|nr:uncharacterized protein LOC101498913 [Cicer arietinum]XP_012574873.1 uncharacterized protein LOC101498913 [Cicer arietinum]